MNANDFGYVRAAAVAPALALGEPQENARVLAANLRRLARERVAIALYPELCLTGYTCEDLFLSQGLLTEIDLALEIVAKATQGIVAVVGLPWRMADGRLLNAAAVVANGQIIGVVPKSTQPNYGEFYELRWFVSGAEVDEVIAHPKLGTFRICRDQLFEVGGLAFAVEICEDLWTVEPPGARHALAGADLILNPSASNELIGKAAYRRDLVRMTSAQRICGYLYASSGPLESTKDVVFGGHVIAAEDGQPLGEGDRFDFAGSSLTVEFDAQRIRHERAQNISFAGAARPTGYTRIDCGVAQRPLASLSRTLTAHPFVPADPEEFAHRAHEIMAIQAAGLARRMLAARCERLVIGLSGGLDSTLAFLVALDALAKLELPAQNLHAFTLPGPGTSSQTLGSAHRLCEAAGLAIAEISIAPAVEQHLKDLDHPQDARDVVFENAQARERTQILFNQANKLGALVVGTGDLSELALGWCTFNADHMASYNVNASVPKTMIAYLVRWYGEHRASEALLGVLEAVLDTPISPELLPPEDGRIAQSTETLIGPYELHDFFLFHFLRSGFEPEKIFFLACASFSNTYKPKTIQGWLAVFFRRFYTQQFKRTTLPPGPKIGSVSLSPRGDWRMPDEASVDRLLERIDGLPVKSKGSAKSRRKTPTAKAPRGPTPKAQRSTRVRKKT
ncbi:MAG: NAD(+) synthase [Pseudomonadota bacterium]